jgi:hypothetical protein
MAKEVEICQLIKPKGKMEVLNAVNLVIVSTALVTTATT